MKIIQYDEDYRDDMIFTVLLAKDALGRKPTINPDLLTINESYIKQGDMFWLAIDENDRVIGCVGYKSLPDTTEVFLHRLYVKPDMKRRGIGTALLSHAEEYIKKQGKTAIRIHLGAPREQWFESYRFYPKNGYRECEERYMIKEL
ncbi:MAG: GNAT family N-acetyltransferase [Acutalibacteraceae bacterium]